MPGFQPDPRFHPATRPKRTPIVADIDTRPQRRKPWRAILLVVAVTALAIWLVPNDSPQVVDLPPASTPGSGEPAAQADNRTGTATSGQSARQLIAAQRDAGKPDPQAAYARARQLAQTGKADDAYLLDFYAARLGHPQAAFALAERADPAHWRAGNALKSPAPAQALKWYRAAAEAGHPDARARVQALRQWATTAAAQGDVEAQRLMLAWQ